MPELSEVVSFYGHSRTPQDISLSIGEGGPLTVLGQNGVGKTTVLCATIGLMDRTTGDIGLDNSEIGTARTDACAWVGISVVPQGRGILQRFTVLENLRFGPFADAHNTGVINESAFENFTALREHLGRIGGNLSGGRQYLALPRALLANPRVIPLNESIEGIQPNLIGKIKVVVIRFNRERGITIVLVEQNVAYAHRTSQRIFIMEKGRIAAARLIAELTEEFVH